MNDNSNKNISRFANLFFLVILFVFWRFFYVNHLVQKEQMQMFLWSWDYFILHLKQPGGLVIYLSEFVIQFFLNKWLAAGFMSLLLYSLALSINKVYIKLKNRNFIVLSFIPAITYHFFLFDKYFQLSGLVAVILSIGSLVIYLNIKRRVFAGILLLLLNYWLLGGAYILYTLSVIIIELLLLFKKNEKISVLPRIVPTLIVYVLLGLLIPFFSYQLLLTENLLESYVSRAFYQISLIFPTQLYLFLGGIPLLFVIAGFVSFTRKEKQYLFTLLFSIGVLALFVIGSVILPNYNEEREMQFDNLVVQKEWNKVISLAEKKVPVGKVEKTALSLALAQTGQMTSRLFEFNPSLDNFFITFNRQGMAPLLANEPYFYLGLTNFSKMLCIESIESKPDGKMPVRSVKRFVENCIIDGQYKVATRYLWYVEKTLFYRKWAKDARTCLNNNDKVEQHPLWGALRSKKTMDDYYFQSERNDVALITLLRSNPQNKTAYEYLMSWYLLQKDFDEFLKYLPLSKSMDYENFPLVFQEALAYVKTLFDEVPDGLEQFPVSAQVQQNLNRYARVFQQGGSNNPTEMKKQFGHTYWYYVHFIETENE